MTRTRASVRSRELIAKRLACTSPVIILLPRQPAQVAGVELPHVASIDSAAHRPMSESTQPFAIFLFNFANE
jgi:hypothetical protein